MNALTFVVPTMVFGFFLWKGRRDPVYILALPLLLAFGRSIFLDMYTWQLTLGGGVAINQGDVLLMTLLVVFVYVHAIRPTASRERLTLQLWLCAFLLVLLMAKAVAAVSSGWIDVVSPSHLFSAAKGAAAARVWFYLPISIMLWHLVLKRFSGQEILRLLRILTWVTTACIVAYLADLAGFRTYTSIWDPYVTLQVAGGVTVFRDYLTLPFWLFAGIACSLAHVSLGRHQATYLLVAVLLTGGALFSFTRTFAFAVVALWVVAIFWAAIVRLRGRSTIAGTRTKPARVLLLMTAFAVVSAAVMFRWSQMAPWWQFLGQRVSELEGGVAGDPNAMLRVNLFQLAARTISHEGFVSGTLMTSPEATGGVYFLDSYWAAVLVSLGWLGLFVVGALVLTALAKASARALRADAGSSLLSLTVFLGLLGAVALSLTGSGWGYAVTAGTFLLAAADVRFRVAPSVSSAAVPTGIEEP